MAVILLNGHAPRLPLADESIQCCITSPPYWGLRKYKVEPQVWGGEAGCGHEWGETRVVAAGRNDQDRDRRHTDGRNPDTQGLVGCPKQIIKLGQFCQLCGAWRGNLGHEPTPEMFTEHLVAIFREVRRVLKKDGTLWVVIGDSYAGSWGNYGARAGNQRSRIAERWHRPAYEEPGHGWNGLPPTAKVPGLKPKDLVGIPWRLAFALQADGWWLRSAIIWHKLNCMPESVRDRPTSAHEYVFLLAKSERYYYDGDAIKEPLADESAGRYRYRFGGPKNEALKAGDKPTAVVGIREAPSGRHKRTVWEVRTGSYSKKHYAAFPPALVEPMVLAGSRRGDVVLDPFCGTGTVGEVCVEHGRRFVGLDLSMEYLAEMARERTAEVQINLGLRELG